MGRVASSSEALADASAGRCPLRTESRCGSESATGLGKEVVSHSQAGESPAAMAFAPFPRAAAFDPAHPAPRSSQAGAGARRPWAPWNTA